MVSFGMTVKATLVVNMKQATSVQHMGTVMVMNGLRMRHLAHVEVETKSG